MPSESRAKQLRFADDDEDPPSVHTASRSASNHQSLNAPVSQDLEPAATTGGNGSRTTRTNHGFLPLSGPDAAESFSNTSFGSASGGHHHRMETIVMAAADEDGSSKPTGDPGSPAMDSASSSNTTRRRFRVPLLVGFIPQLTLLVAVSIIIIFILLSLYEDSTRRLSRQALREGLHLYDDRIASIFNSTAKDAMRASMYVRSQWQHSQEGSENLRPLFLRDWVITAGLSASNVSGNSTSPTLSPSTPESLLRKTSTALWSLAKSAVATNKATGDGSYLGLFFHQILATPPTSDATPSPGSPYMNDSSTVTKPNTVLFQSVSGCLPHSCAATTAQHDYVETLPQDTFSQLVPSKTTLQSTAFDTKWLQQYPAPVQYTQVATRTATIDQETKGNTATTIGYHTLSYPGPLFTDVGNNKESLLSAVGDSEWSQHDNCVDGSNRPCYVFTTSILKEHRAPLLTRHSGGGANSSIPLSVHEATLSIAVDVQAQIQHVLQQTTIPLAEIAVVDPFSEVVVDTTFETVPPFTPLGSDLIVEKHKRLSEVVSLSTEMLAKESGGESAVDSTGYTGSVVQLDAGYNDAVAARYIICGDGSWEYAAAGAHRNNAGKVKLLLVIISDKSYFNEQFSDAIASVVTTTTILLLLAIGCTVITALSIRNPIRQATFFAQETAQLLVDSTHEEMKSTGSVFVELDELQRANIDTALVLSQVKSFVPQSVLSNVSVFSGGNSASSVASASGGGRIHSSSRTRVGVSSLEEGAYSSGNDSGLSSGNDGEESSERQQHFTSLEAPQQQAAPHSSRLRRSRQRKSISADGTNPLTVNLTRVNAAVNELRPTPCTVLFINLVSRAPPGNIDFASAETAAFMHGTIPHILKVRGIIETQRPDQVVAVFDRGVHAERATICALRIIRSLRKAETVAVALVHTGQFWSGSCGANGRNCYVTTGSFFQHAPRILELSARVLKCHVLVTSDVAKSLPVCLQAVPVDNLGELDPLSVSAFGAHNPTAKASGGSPAVGTPPTGVPPAATSTEPLRLYEVYQYHPAVAMHLPRIKEAFSYMLRGDFANAADVAQRAIALIDQNPISAGVVASLEDAQRNPLNISDDNRETSGASDHGSFAMQSIHAAVESTGVHSATEEALKFLLMRFAAISTSLAPSSPTVSTDDGRSSAAHHIKYARYFSAWSFDSNRSSPDEIHLLTGYTAAMQQAMTTLNRVSSIRSQLSIGGGEASAASPSSSGNSGNKPSDATELFTDPLPDIPSGFVVDMMGNRSGNGPPTALLQHGNAGPAAVMDPLQPPPPLQHLENFRNSSGNNSLAAGGGNTTMILDSATQQQQQHSSRIVQVRSPADDSEGDIISAKRAMTEMLEARKSQTVAFTSAVDIDSKFTNPDPTESLFSMALPEKSDDDDEDDDEDDLAQNSHNSNKSNPTTVGVKEASVGGTAAAGSKTSASGSSTIEVGQKNESGIYDNDDDYGEQITPHGTGVMAKFDGLTKAQHRFLAAQNGFDTKVPTRFVDIRGQLWLRAPNTAHLGEGAFSKVHKGMNVQGDVVALKCIDIDGPSLSGIDFLKTEVGILSEIHHANLASFISLAVHKSLVILILEFVAGGTLRTTINSYGKALPSTAAKRFALDILRGLHYLHERRVVHGDIKPENVLMGADSVCKITDFGSSVERRIVQERNFYKSQNQSISQLLGAPPASTRAAGGGSRRPSHHQVLPMPAVQSSNSSNNNAAPLPSSSISTAPPTHSSISSLHSAIEDGTMDIRGTAPYMAPEVASGELPTNASDVWSFGILLHELITGNQPWAHAGRAAKNTVELMRGLSRPVGTPGYLRPEIQFGSDGSVSDVDQRVARRVIASCLQEDPRDRPTMEMLLSCEYFL